MASTPCALFAYLVGAATFFAMPCAAQGDRYFIATQPGTGSILYIREGETVMRTLLLGGHEALGAIAIDPTSAHLYVADPALAIIYWYQLIALPSKNLITDGRKHVAIKGVVAQSLACDSSGNLFIAGQAITDVTPSAPPPPYAIIRIDIMQILTGFQGIPVIEGIHNRANTGSPPKMFDPTAMFADGANIWWVNGKQGGSHGTVVKGGAGGGGYGVVIDQGEQGSAIGQSGEFMFYSTENGIFGASLGKKESGCGAPAPPPSKFNPMKASLGGGDQGPCHLISNEIKSTRGMFWDGDGTMYTMDPTSGIYSFPAGNLEPHRVTQVAKVTGTVDLQILFVPAFASMQSIPSAMLLAALFLWKTSL